MTLVRPTGQHRDRVAGGLVRRDDERPVTEAGQESAAVLRLLEVLADQRDAHRVGQPLAQLGA
jgi:hypothetical protein